MRTADFILVSFVKGIFLSLVLLFLQTYLSSVAASHHNERKILTEINSKLPQNTDQHSDDAVIKQSGGLHASGQVFINREILCLFEIIFSDNVELDKSYISVPIPLASLLSVLFYSSISINAP